MSLKPDIILVGGGGHCKVVISIIKKLDTFNIAGISDLKENLGKEVLGIETRYTDDQLEELHDKGIKYAFVTLGSVGNPDNRIRLFEMLKQTGFEIPVIISKDAIVDESVEIEEGTVIMPGAIINPGTKIGKNCIINTGAVIDHDCMIGDHVHIAPGVTLSGSVKIGSSSHIGTGASVIHGIEIGSRVIVGAGSVVVNTIQDNKKVMGVPARDLS
ncbi:putative acetyltransferase EpsM [Mesotoga infera]|uniref:Putative acetyltransferase EpsM n=1 Tax=Mesotoga infera TaxID=1236046 RepID=A0A7Z7PQU4_9BACT|nr:acetyltransferase [Mesotoga infera]SSC12123.1 putative acetyltransferase EpsM [Mesotoga infera]